MNGVGLPIAYPLNKEDEQKFRVYQLISMVIENLKNKWLLDASAIFKKLNDSGSISYLSEGYDCLHTLSIERIIDDIEVSRMKRNVVNLHPNLWDVITYD